jgi:hypothetical protein
MIMMIMGHEYLKKGIVWEGSRGGKGKGKAYI